MKNLLLGKSMSEIFVKLLPLLLISILAVVSVQIFSAEIDINSLFEEAVAHYDERNYQEALDAFLSLEEAGIESYELYYNIGNSYFRLNKTGKAILYYKRGLRLNPGDFQLQANLEFAISQTKDRQETEENNPLIEVVRNTVNTIPLNVWFILALISFLPVVAFINITLIYYRGRDKTVPVFLLIVFSVVWLIVLSAANYRWNRYQDQSTAVLTAGSTNGYSGPDPDYTRLFTVNEGVILDVVEYREDWSQVRLPTGVIGWIRTDDFSLVNP